MSFAPCTFSAAHGRQSANYPETGLWHELLFRNINVEGGFSQEASRFEGEYSRAESALSPLQARHNIRT